MTSPRRFEEVTSDHEPETAKSAKRPRESDAVEHELTTSDKISKKKAKKLKAENGAAVPAPADADGTAQKKSEKKDKKGKKAAGSKEGDSKKEKGDVKPKQGDKGGSDLRELPSHLKIQDAKVGDGPEAKKGMKVSMRYIGKLASGEVFDSNTKGKPVSCPPISVLSTDSPDRRFIVHFQIGGRRSDQRCVIEGVTSATSFHVCSCSKAGMRGSLA